MKTRTRILVFLITALFAFMFLASCGTNIPGGKAGDGTAAPDNTGGKAQPAAKRLKRWLWRS